MATRGDARGAAASRRRGGCELARAGDAAGRAVDGHAAPPMRAVAHASRGSTFDGARRGHRRLHGVRPVPHAHACGARRRRRATPTGCSSARRPAPRRTRSGEPFVGQAGPPARQHARGARARARRSDVYIANVLKCRPPNNRTPGAARSRRLPAVPRPPDRAVAPKLIVALGRARRTTLLDVDAIDREPARSRASLSRRAR